MTRQMLGDVSSMQLGAAVDRVPVPLNDDGDFHCASGSDSGGVDRSGFASAGSDGCDSTPVNVIKSSRGGSIGSLTATGADVCSPIVTAAGGAPVRRPRRRRRRRLRCPGPSAGWPGLAGAGASAETEGIAAGTLLAGGGGGGGAALGGIDAVAGWRRLLRSAPSSVVCL
jgi:hypothetical protein